MLVRWKASRAIPVAALALLIIVAFVHSRLRNGNVSARANKPSSSSSFTFTSARGHQRVRLKDVFIAVKSTRQFHRNRLALLLDTWISKTKEHVRSFKISKAHTHIHTHTTHTHTHAHTTHTHRWCEV